MFVCVGTKKLDFGKVSIRATVYKSLTITNDLKTNILVTVATERPELGQSRPESQVMIIM